MTTDEMRPMLLGFLLECRHEFPVLCRHEAVKTLSPTKYLCTNCGQTAKIDGQYVCTEQDVYDTWKPLLASHCRHCGEARHRVTDPFSPEGFTKLLARINRLPALAQRDFLLEIFRASVLDGQGRDDLLVTSQHVMLMNLTPENLAPAICKVLIKHKEG